jgi:hypothetical protein
VQQTRETNEELALDIATAMIEAIGTSSWSSFRPRFEALFEGHSDRLEETVRRIAGASEEARPALREGEASRWAGRLESDLDADPRLRSAARDLLRETTRDLLRASRDPETTRTPTTGVGGVKNKNMVGINGAVGTGSTVTVRQTDKTKNNNTRRTFLMPFFGPLVNNPMAVAVTVVVVGGATLAAVAAHSPLTSPSVPSVSRNIKLEAQSQYDFSALPPKISSGASSNDLTYDGSFQNNLTMGDEAHNVAVYTGAGVPTAAQCESAVDDLTGMSNLYDEITVTQGETLCFVLDDEQIGYLNIVQEAPAFIVVDAAYLGKI